MKRLFVISIVLATTTAFASIGQVERIALNKIEGIVTSKGDFTPRVELQERVSLQGLEVIDESLTIVTNTQEEREATSIVLNGKEILIIRNRGAGDFGGG